jgi:hypothetical protein
MKQQQHLAPPGPAGSNGKHAKPHGGNHSSRKVGAALSIDKWAASRISKYDKRRVIEQQKQRKAKQVNKLKRLKRRLDAEGRLQAPTPLVRAVVCAVWWSVCWVGGLHTQAGAVQQHIR